MINKKESAVVVRDLHKEFTLPQHKNSTFKQTVVNIVKQNKKVTQKVLDGVSFTVDKGDFFGIVGRNGSGKSTLLKLIAGVYTPTAGEIEINGGLTPFIELGVGFNQELTGRDNVYLNGALMGFNRKQMNEMFDEIVEFAELEQFMDQKLKNYSSGMQVRLAFSIAIKAKNEILIFDEVLAVGDEAFQRKCIDVFEKYKAEGQTVILVTHNMETVRRFCNKAVLINDGKILDIGNAQIVSDHYSRLNQDVITRSLNATNQKYNSDKSLTVTCLNVNNKIEGAFKAGEIIRLRLTYKDDPRIYAFVFNIYKRSGEHLTGFRATIDEIDNVRNTKEIIADIPARFAVGKYHVFVQKLDSTEQVIGDVFDGPEFMVTSNLVKGETVWSGLVPIEHTLYSAEKYTKD